MRRIKVKHIFKHRELLMSRLIQLSCVSLLIILLVANSSFASNTNYKFENNLAEHLDSVDESTLVPVYIGLQNPYPVDQLVQDVQGMTLPQRRQHTVETLQDHFANQAGEISNWLNDEIRAGRATNLHPLWIAHGFIVNLQADRIPDLSEIDEIARVRFDQPLQFDQVNDEIIESDKSNRSVNELDEISWAVEYIGAVDLWDLGYHGENIIVSIIDSGVYLEHADLVDHVWTNEDEIPGNGIDDDLNGYIDDINGWNFYSNNPDISDVQGHGTKCTGIVAGDGTLGTQTGVAPEATWMMIRNYQGGWSSEGTRAASVQYAVTNGASIISCSLSYDRVEPTYIPDYVTHRYTYTSLLAAGVMSTNSTGNNNPGAIPWNINAPGNSPAPFLHPDQTVRGGISGVLAIGAHEADGIVEGFTGNGPSSWEDPDWPISFQDYPYADGTEMGLLKPDILAPSGVPTTDDGGGYLGSFSGTSAASPVVGGALTLLRSIHQQAPPEAMAESIIMTALDGGDPGFDNTYGSGLLRIDEAHLYLDQLYDYGSLHVTIETGGGPPTSVSVIVGDGELLSTVQNQDEVLLERVFPGTYDVIVDLPDNDRRYFSGIVIEGGLTTELIVQVDNEQFTVSPDELDVTATDPSEMHLDFEVTNPNVDPILLDVIAVPPGGIDWVPDLEIDVEADSARTVTASTMGILVGGWLSGQPYLWQYQAELDMYEQPERFGNAGCEAATLIQRFEFGFLFERKVYTSESLYWMVEVAFTDSLQIPEAIVDPAGLTYRDTSYYVADNTNRTLYEFDANDGTITGTFNLDGIIVRSLSTRFTHDFNPDLIEILGEDPAGDRFLATLDVATGELITHPIIRPNVGYNPRAMVYDYLLNGPNWGTVLVDSSGIIRRYWREMKGNPILDIMPVSIEQGTRELVIEIDDWLFRPHSASHFDVVFQGVEEGFQDTSQITLRRNYTSIEEFKAPVTLPTTATLEKIYPNPFNASVTIEYALPNPGKVRLAVYDLLGREVVVLDNSHHVAGSHTLTWTPAKHASGVYFAVLETQDATSTKKLLLMK
jgi:subtilisin family serine protease